MDEIFSTRPDEQVKNADNEIQNYILTLEKKLKNCISLRNLNKEIEMKFVTQQDELNSLKLQNKEYSKHEQIRHEEIQKVRIESKCLATQNEQLKQQVIRLQKEVQQLKENGNRNVASATSINTEENKYSRLNNVADNDPNANSVLIKGISENQLNLIPKINIIDWAHLMNIKLTGNDIVKISQMERKFYERHNLKPNKIILIVQLRTPELKVEFLKNKEKLKLHQHLEDIEIIDYVSDEVYNLYQYAKILKSSGYALIYWRNNCVYAKKTRSTLCEPIIIKSKNDVDTLKVARNK